MFLDQHPCWSWNNIPINQSQLRDTFTGNVCFRITTRVRCFCTLVIQLSFPSDFWDKLWVGKVRGRDRVRFMFLDSNVVPGTTKDIVQEHVWLGMATDKTVYLDCVNTDKRSDSKSSKGFYPWVIVIPTLSHGNSYVFYEVANLYEFVRPHSYDLVRFV